MARSDYVYLVWDDHAGVPAMTFTVKREMVGWLRGRANTEHYRIWRMRDGTHYKDMTTELSVSDLLDDR